MIKLNGGIGKPYADEYKPQYGAAYKINGCYLADGTQRDFGVVSAYDGPATVGSSNGDYVIINIFKTASETVLLISHRNASVMGIFDVYVNGVLDTAGIDAYASTSSDSVLKIVLTQSLVSGWNEIKLKINGKNASSSNYGIGIYSVRYL